MVHLDENSHGTLGYRIYSTASGQYPAICVPVEKNDLVSVTYSEGTSDSFFRFVYAQGSESEAPAT